MRKKYSKILSTLLSIAILTSIMTIAANAASISFTDVPSTHWAYEAVTTCAEKGIVNGMGNGTFAPDNPLTNAQFVTMTVNAFYSESLDNAAVGSWYTPYMNAARKANLLSGTAIANSDAPADVGMTRYDMAQMLHNALRKNGNTVTDAQLNAAKASIKDWSIVPVQYQEAVSTCFALGILSGMGDGSFSGSSTMTRAQACVVLNRLEDAVQNGANNPSTKPENSPTSKTDIDVTLNGRAYTVGDNGFETGYLNNGKPITEANVLELLKIAEEKWPSSTKDTLEWSENTSTTYYYGNPGSIVTKVMNSFTPIVHTQYGCGGFASMISDYVFGKSNNPARKLDDLSKVRPGDIIVKINGSVVDHVMIATSSVIRYGNFIGAYFTDGNDNNTIRWEDEFGSPSLEYFNLPTGATYVIYTRYPA